MSIAAGAPPAKSPSDRASIVRLACLVAVSVLLNTLISAIVGEKTVFLYKETLHLSASAITILHLVLAAPRYLQPFLGAWTEITPWLGYHRRPYYACGILLAALSYLLLAGLHEYHYGTIRLLMLIVGSDSEKGAEITRPVHNASVTMGLLPNLGIRRCSHASNGGVCDLQK